MKSLFQGATEKFLTLSRKSLKPDPTSYLELCQIWGVNQKLLDALELQTKSLLLTIQWSLVYDNVYAGEFGFAVFVQIHIPSACRLGWTSLIWASFWWEGDLQGGRCCKCSAQTPPSLNCGETGMMDCVMKHTYFTVEAYPTLTKSSEKP